MAIAQALNKAPGGNGLGDFGFDAETEPLEIVISDDGITAPEKEEKPSKFEENLVTTLKDLDVGAIAADVLADINIDLESRKDWEQTYQQGLDLLGLKIEQRTEPWNGACGVYHPILAEAVVRFQSETIMETFPAAGPVKTQIIGKITKEKEEAAIRVKDDMNLQLTNVMPDYRSEHERLLWALPIAGSAFKKIYYDPGMERQVAMFIPAEDIIVPYGASTLDQSPRITHRMKKTENEILKLQVSGFYDEDVDIGGPPQTETTKIEQSKDKLIGVQATQDDRYTLYESHVELHIEEDPHHDKDGIALPYVVTINKSTGGVLSVYRNWEEDDDKKRRRMHFVHYGYIPGYGFYCFGLIHLIGGFAKSATSILRQLVDAGTLSNLPGGLKTKGLRVKGDDTPIRPGEWRDADIGSGVLRDNIMPLPYKEPSATLYQLLQSVVDEGRRFAAMSDLKVSDMSSESPVGTTLAILERTLKVMSAVQARVHAAMKNEFKLLKNIIRDNAPEDYSYDPDTPGDDAQSNRKVKQADYDTVEIIPVSDPNAATMSQRIVQYQAALQLATTAPQIYDLPYLHKQMLETLGIKNINKVIPNSDDQKPKDPVTENMAVIMGKPVKAFIDQDHDAHIKVHTTCAQDPKIQQMVGQNPQGALITNAMAAHIMEHVGMQYRRNMEKMMGVPLPMPDENLPQDIESLLSKTLADAADKLLGKDQQEAAALAAQQAAQDPVVQLQQQDMKIKEAEVQRKSDKDKADVILKKQEMELRERLEKEKLAAQAHTSGAQIGGQLAAARMNAENQRAVADSQKKHEGSHKEKQMAHEALQKHLDRAHTLHTSQQDKQHETKHKTADISHEATQNEADRELQLKQAEHQVEAAKASAKVAAKKPKAKK